MSHSNPVIDIRLKQQQERKKKLEYPVRVCCVVDNLSDSNGDILKIKAHAHNSGATFVTRVYDSRKYSDDCYQITRLPAFHIYISGSYNRTFYPNTRPLQHIDESIEICIKWEKQKVERKQRWIRLYNYFASLIKKIGRRETRMERYQREQELEMTDTTRFQNSRIRSTSIPISEWN